MRRVETPLVAGKPYPPHLLRAARVLLRSAVSMLEQNPAALALARSVLDRYPEHRPALEAGAIDADASPVELTLGLLSYDLLMGMYGCSTVALATADGPVVARNMDWSSPDLIARASCVVPTDNGHSAGFIGGVGVVTGLSRAGFTVVLNAVGCP